MKNPPYLRYPTAAAWIAHTFPIKLHIVLSSIFVCGSFGVISMAGKNLFYEDHSVWHFSKPGAMIGTLTGLALAAFILESTRILHKQECQHTCRKSTH